MTDITKEWEAGTAQVDYWDLENHCETLSHKTVEEALDYVSEQNLWDGRSTAGTLAWIEAHAPLKVHAWKRNVLCPHDVARMSERATEACVEAFDEECEELSNPEESLSDTDPDTVARIAAGFLRVLQKELADFKPWGCSDAGYIVLTKQRLTAMLKSSRPEWFVESPTGSSSNEGSDETVGV